MFNILQDIDTQLFQLINSTGNNIVDPIMIALSSHALWIILAAVFLIIAAWKKNKRLGLALLLVGLSLSLTDFTSAYLLKPGFGRLRPCHQLEDIRSIQAKCGSKYGFPSNHAANAASAFVCIAYMYRRRSLFAFGGTMVALTGLSRIYLGVHFPFDVLAGFIYGSAVACLVLFSYRKVVQRYQLAAPAPYL